MSSARRGAVLACALFCVLAARPAQAALATCTNFQTAFARSLSGFRVEFTRSLVVSRGQGAASDVYDLVTDVEVDGSLQCRGEKLLRFEAKIAVPPSSRVADRFERVKQMALAAALGWRGTRVTSTLKEMDDEVADYLRASQERGDVFISGKTENHEGGSDLGLIWTLTDRTFIIVGD